MSANSFQRHSFLKTVNPIDYYNHNRTIFPVFNPFHSVCFCFSVFSRAVLKYNFLIMKRASATFVVTNLHLQTSADTILRAVRALEGIESAEIDILSGTMQVVFDEEKITRAEIREAAGRTGYEVHSASQSFIRTSKDEETSDDKPLMFLAGGTFLLLVCALFSLSPLLSLLVLCATLFLSRSVLQKYTGRLAAYPYPYILKLIIFLCSLTGGLIRWISGGNPAYYFLYAAVILLVFELTEQICGKQEKNISRSVFETSSSRLPADALVYEGHTEEMRHLEDIRENELLILRPTQISPVDGTVLSGSCEMDESALTGNNTPVRKKEGSPVYAGSKCISGSVKIRAEHTGSDTAAMHFALFAENTANDRAFPSPLKTIGKTLPFYMIAGAAAALAGWYMIRPDMTAAVCTGLSVLCAETLLSFSQATANTVLQNARSAAEKHILFRSVQALESLGKTDVFVIDQDDALTSRAYTVTDFIPADPDDPSRLEYVAYALESKSEDQVGKAVARYLKTRSIVHVDAGSFRQFNRRGRKSQNRDFRVLKEDQMTAEGIPFDKWKETAEQLKADGKQVLFFLDSQSLCGIIAVRKMILTDAESFLAFARENETEIRVFTKGEACESAYLAGKLRLENVIHNADKEQKQKLLAGLEEAGSLTALVSGGRMRDLRKNTSTAVAINAGAGIDRDDADVLLTRNRLSDLKEAVRISQTTNTAVQQYQLSVLMYHAVAAAMFGAFLPSFIPPVFLPLLAAGCSLLCAALTFHRKPGQ